MSVEVPPPDVIFRVLPHLWSFLWRLSYLPWPPEGIVTSWYRDIETNQRVRGVPGSLHLWGLALDIVVDDPNQLARVAVSLGLVPLVEPDHLHLQAMPSTAWRPPLPQIA